MAGILTKVLRNFCYILRRLCLYMRIIYPKSDLWSSCCGATGSAVSLELWDAGSIPNLAQWVKDPVIATAVA